MSSIVKEIKRWWESMFQREAQDCFKVSSMVSAKMRHEEMRWYNTYTCRPEWVCYKKGMELETINFAKTICNETAKLVTLALSISVEGSARAEWIQEQINRYIAKLKLDKVEYACAMGYIVIKPNGSSLDYVLPGEFVPTESDNNGKICAGIFIDRLKREEKFYTRLEYHRFINTEQQTYMITNKAFVSDAQGTMGKEIDISKSPWTSLLPEVGIEGIDRPMFAVFGMPIANSIDVGSSIPVSIFCNAMTELKRLDIASQRMADEIDDSKKLIIVGDSFTSGLGTKINRFIDKLFDRQGNELPRYIRAIPGNDAGDDYHEINPQINTESRMTGINHFLDSVGIKCGFSSGQFVLNGRNGHVTATQVEADDRETIQTIKNIRDALQSASDDIIYILDKWADLYELVPTGEYKVTYNFGDITYNEDEDRARNWQYVQAGKYPAWRYYNRFEGMSEEEAKAAVAEAKEERKSYTLFDEE